MFPLTEEHWYLRNYNVLFGRKKQHDAVVFSLSEAKLVESVHITTLSSISALMCHRHGSNYAANRKHAEAQFEVKLAELDVFGLKCPPSFFKSRFTSCFLYEKSTQPMALHTTWRLRLSRLSDAAVSQKGDQYFLHAALHGK